MNAGRLYRSFPLSGKKQPIFALLIALSACPRATGPSGTRTLDGATVPLKPSPALRLSVDGTLEGRAAEVVFEVRTLASSITTGCFEGGAPTTGDELRIDTEVFPEVDVSGLVFADIRYHAFHAALMKGDRCEITLGNEQLLPWALSVDVARRTLSFSKSRTREEWSAWAVSPPKERTGFETHLIELTKDPKTDAPMLPVRIRQNGEEIMSVFRLATGISQSEAWGAGLRKGFQLLEGIELPDGVQIPAELEAFKGIPYESVELAPQVGVRDGVFREMVLAHGSPEYGGLLGGDVWGRFDAIIDLKAGVLLLQRPRVLASGSHQRCERGGALNEEACYQLEVEKTAHGLLATSTIWRALPEGGRLHLEFISDKGPLPLSCRVGFTFSPSDRGDNTQHELPWDRLRQTMPLCAQVAASATKIEMSMFEDGELPECPGTCAFAQDLRTGRVSCECQPAVSGAATEQERQFLRLYKQLLQGKKPGFDSEQEPEDPP